MKRKYVLLLLAGVIQSVAADGNPLHVSPSGNDTNDGASGKPLKSLSAARDAARTSKKTGKAADGVGIVLHGGPYRLTEPLVLSSDDSGGKNSPLRFVAAPGEKPVLTSAREITGWKQLEHPARTISPQAAGKLWVADIAKGWLFHYLYVDGEAQHMARMSNTDDWTTWPVLGKEAVVEPQGTLIPLPAHTLDGLQDNGDIEMNVMPVMYWNSLVVLRNFNLAASTARAHSRNPTQKVRKGFIDGRYNLQNGLKFIDEPGEWCVDTSEGKVYLWPKGDVPLTNRRVTAPTLNRLIHIKGGTNANEIVRNIEFSGITFECTDRLPEDQWPDEWTKRCAELPDGMIYIENAEDCVIVSNMFRHSGSYCVVLEKHAQRNRIEANEMAHPDGGGVLLEGYGPGTLDVNKSNVVRRNWIHDTGASGYLHSGGLTIYQSGGNDISLNLIENVPYIGIQIHGMRHDEVPWNPRDFITSRDYYGNTGGNYKVRWDELPDGGKTPISRADFNAYLHSRNNRIADNVILRYLTRIHDGAALYTWHGGTGTVWEGNVIFRDFRTPREKWCFGIYMDDTDESIVRNNVGWHLGVPTRNVGPNTWADNVISSNKPPIFDARLAELESMARREGGWPGVKSVAEKLRPKQ